MAQNIKFEYLYRDADNFKNYGSVIFSNPDEISLVEIINNIENFFSQKLFFIAHQIGLQELYFEGFSSSNDISFHEFDRVKVTDELPNDINNRTIKQFIRLIETESSKGWDVFDPTDRIFHFDKSST